MDLISDVADWITRRLGKGIVYMMPSTLLLTELVFAINQIKHTEDLELNVETVDALLGKLIGHPSSATFRTMDVVGIDVCTLVAANVYDKVKRIHTEIFSKLLRGYLNS